MLYEITVEEWLELLDEVPALATEEDWLITESILMQ